MTFANGKDKHFRQNLQVSLQVSHWRSTFISSLSSQLSQLFAHSLHLVFFYQWRECPTGRWRLLEVVLDFPFASSLFQPTTQSSYQAYYLRGAVICPLPLILGATPLVQITTAAPGLLKCPQFTSLQSVPQVAARVIFLKCKYDQVILHFKIFQWLPISHRMK